LKNSIFQKFNSDGCDRSIEGDYERLNGDAKNENKSNVKLIEKDPILNENKNI